MVNFFVGEFFSLNQKYLAEKRLLNAWCQCFTFEFRLEQLVRKIINLIFVFAWTWNSSQVPCNSLHESVSFGWCAFITVGIAAHKRKLRMQSCTKAAVVSLCLMSIRANAYMHNCIHSYSAYICLFRTNLHLCYDTATKPSALLVDSTVSFPRKLQHCFYGFSIP